MGGTVISTNHNSIDNNIIKDIVTLAEHRQGGDLPPLPIPDLESGKLVFPSHIERLPDAVKTQILDWYLEDKSVREISAELQIKGYSVHHLRIWRFCKANFRGDALDVPEMEEEMRDKLMNKAITNMMDILMNLSKKINLRNIEVRCVKEVEMLASAMGKIQSSHAAYKRVKHEEDGGAKKMAETMKFEVKHLLQGNPQLINEVHAYIDKAAEKIIANGI